MRRITFVTFIGFLMVVNQSFSIIRTITVSDFSFSPADMTVNVGDVIKWVWVNGSHTTTSTNITNGANSWNSNISSSKTTFEYTVTVAGTYNYKCSPHENMGMVGSFTAVSTTSAEVKKNEEISVFPNPFKDIIQVNSSDPILSVEVFDITGKKIVDDDIKYQDFANRKEIDLSSLKQGIYFALVNTDKKKTTIKIVKR